MKLIVGLGNPGQGYAATRHNAGRRLIEYIASHRPLAFSKKKSLYVSIASLEWDGQPVTLAFPEVFMNLSGTAVHQLVNHLSIDPKKNLLIVVDDFALPFGHLRLRSRGSDGGHNGLKSIHQTLGSSEYARLRLGIGRPSLAPPLGEASFEKYVLSSFNSKEKKDLEAFLERGVQACRLWVTQPIERAMNVINIKQPTS